MSGERGWRRGENQITHSLWSLLRQKWYDQFIKCQFIKRKMKYWLTNSWQVRSTAADGIIMLIVSWRANRIVDVYLLLQYVDLFVIWPTVWFSPLSFIVLVNEVLPHPQPSPVRRYTSRSLYTICNMLELICPRHQRGFFLPTLRCEPRT